MGRLPREVGLKLQRLQRERARVGADGGDGEGEYAAPAGALVEGCVHNRPLSDVERLLGGPRRLQPLVDELPWQPQALAAREGGAQDLVPGDRARECVAHSRGVGGADIHCAADGEPRSVRMRAPELLLLWRQPEARRLGGRFFRQHVSAPFASIRWLNIRDAVDRMLRAHLGTHYATLGQKHSGHLPDRLVRARTLLQRRVV